MAEYIDRYYAIKELYEYYDYNYPTASGDFDEYATHEVPNILRNIPASDVQPVTYTRWIELDDRTMCSNCGASYDDKYEQVRNHWKCCPNCEAKVIKSDSRGDYSLD